MRAPSKSSRSRTTESSDPASAFSSTETGEIKKWTPRDPEFGLSLTDHGVHPLYSSQKPDLEDVRASLAAAGLKRPSLSSFNFSERAFIAFQDSNIRARDEDDVMAHVIPTILGSGQTKGNCASNTAFSALQPLTDGKITAAKPDIYWGAYPEQLAPSARNELAGHVVPSRMLEKPIAPNVFMEVKGPNGTEAVATRQVRHDGANGARAMHSLKNYGLEQPQYDGKPYTFSFTYYHGTLTKYSHHVTGPTTEGGRPEYHVSQMDAWSMTGKRGTFVEAATDLRNTLDLAETYRENFIRDANARAPRAETGLPVAGQTSTGSASLSETRSGSTSHGGTSVIIDISGAS